VLLLRRMRLVFVVDFEAFAFVALLERGGGRRGPPRWGTGTAVVVGGARTTRLTGKGILPVRPPVLGGW
jgi:hypothetical protein